MTSEAQRQVADKLAARCQLRHALGDQPAEHAVVTPVAKHQPKCLGRALRLRKPRDQRRLDVVQPSLQQFVSRGATGEGRP